MEFKKLKLNTLKLKKIIYWNFQRVLNHYLVKKQIISLVV